MPVHARRRQHMRAIDGHALRFVDGRGIAVIDMGIILEVEHHPAAAIEPHRHAASLTCSSVPSVPFFTPMLRSLRRNMIRSPDAKSRRPRSTVTPVLAQPARRAPRSRASWFSSRTSALVWVRMIRVLSGSA
jgi:hypothetical protein